MTVFTVAINSVNMLFLIFSHCRLADRVRKLERGPYYVKVCNEPGVEYHIIDGEAA